MTKLITIEYDEYQKLLEINKLNNEQIIEEANKMFSKFQEKFLEDQRYIELLDKHSKNNDKSFLKSFIDSNTNIFGYVKAIEVKEYINKM